MLKILHNNYCYYVHYFIIFWYVSSCISTVSSDCASVGPINLFLREDQKRLNRPGSDLKTYLKCVVSFMSI